jgi:hypothetical protein
MARAFALRRRAPAFAKGFGASAVARCASEGGKPSGERPVARSAKAFALRRCLRFNVARSLQASVRRSAKKPSRYAVVKSGHGPYAISHQPSAISHQPSAISHQPSAISHDDRQ